MLIASAYTCACYRMAAAAGGGGGGGGKPSNKIAAVDGKDGKLSTAGKPTVLDNKRRLDPSIKMLLDCVFLKYAGDATEVEFRLGTLVNRTTTERHQLMGMTVCVPLANHKQTFKPGVSKESFDHLMKTLKEGKVRFSRTVTNDVIYEHGVRRCNETGKTILKQRLSDLDYTNPSAAYDIRLSVSTEQPCNAPSSSSPIVMLRRKDRTSFYKDDKWRIDMTVVKKNNSEVTYEVEVEVLGLASAIDACRNKQSAPLKDFLMLSLQHVEALATVASLVVPPVTLDDVKLTPKAAQERAKAAFDKALADLRDARDPNDPVWKAWGELPDQLLDDT